MSQPPAKRKRTEDDIRPEEVYFVEHNVKPLCLICARSLAPTAFKRSNISRHYEKEHLNKAPECALTGQLRKDKIVKLKRNLQVPSITWPAPSH